MADQTVPQLTGTAVLGSADLLYVVRDPNGTPVDRKMTTKNFFGSIAQNTAISASSFTVTANVTIGGIFTFNPNSNTAYDFRVKGGSAEALFVDSGNNNIGFGTILPQVKLDVASDKIRVRTALTPGSSNATTVGVKTGTIFWDSNYIYVVTDTNTIKRASLNSF